MLVKIAKSGIKNDEIGVGKLKIVTISKRSRILCGKI